jgi:DNA-binding response OmpR family regulator
MLRILVIDDDRSIRDILSLLLKRMGHEVEIAEDGEYGISIFLESGGFDAVITDIRMPLRNGNQVARYIRNSAKSHVAIIAMSAFPEEIEKKLFDYSIEKPFRLAVLMKILRVIDSQQAANVVYEKARSD